MHCLAVQGEGKGAGEELGGGAVISGAVFVVAYQGVAPGGKLDPDLVAATGVEQDANQGNLPRPQAGEFQPGGFDPLALPPDDEHLVFPAVLPQ